MSADLRGHIRATLVLGAPLVGSHLAQIAITLTDTVMLGWYDVEALAGLVIAGSFYFTIFLVGSGFAWAVMPVVATALGRQDQRQARRATRMGLWLSIIYGAVFMVPMFAGERILLSLGQTEEVAAQGGLYLSIAAWGLIPNLVIMVLKGFLSALERTQVVLWVTLGSAALNVVVNYVLIFGNFGAPEMGIRGAAIASVSIQIAGTAMLVIYVRARATAYELFRNFNRPDWEAFIHIFRLGWPIGLTSLAEVGLFSLASVMVGWIGTLELAAHGIALNIASVTFMVHLGLSQAATVRVGNALGRGDRVNMRMGAGVALALSMAAVSLTIIAFLVIPEPLIGLFLDPDEPDRAAILAVGAILLAVAALFQLADAAQVMALGMLRGVQDTTVPMVMASVSYWGIGAPASWVLGFPLGLGAAGIWLGLAIGLGVAAGLLSHRFWRGKALG